MWISEQSASVSVKRRQLSTQLCPLNLQGLLRVPQLVRVAQVVEKLLMLFVSSLLPGVDVP